MKSFPYFAEIFLIKKIRDYRFVLISEVITYLPALFVYNRTSIIFGTMPFDIQLLLLLFVVVVSFVCLFVV